MPMLMVVVLNEDPCPLVSMVEITEPTEHATVE